MENIWTTELTNTCNCIAVHCPDCGEIVTATGALHDAMICPFCDLDFDGRGLTTVDDFYCDGWCWEDMTDQVSFLWDEFQKLAPAYQDFYRLTGLNMGWRNRDGSAIVDMENVKPWEVISVDSEWRQLWTLDRDARTLKVVQSHHDSMGESYEFIPLTSEEVDRIFG